MHHRFKASQDHIIADNPRKTMLAGGVLLALAAIGAQPIIALIGICAIAAGAMAWGSEDLHLAKQRYKQDRFEKELGKINPQAGLRHKRIRK